MTRSEFYDKIRQYESKWGKLGESKSIVHSAPETKEEPVSCTEEYKQFRKKVAEGRKKDRLIHTTVISPEDLNARYHQELFDNNVLIHTDINKYYRKVDLGNGNYRYFYSKEEYDAYVDNKNKQGASQDNAKGKGNDYQKWLDQQKAKNDERPSESPAGDDVQPSKNNKHIQPTVDSLNLTIEAKETNNTSSADNAKGKGNDYQKWLDEQKNKENYEKNAAYDRNKDLMRYNSKWEDGKQIYNENQRNTNNLSTGRFLENHYYDDRVNSFLNQIDCDGHAIMDSKAQDNVIKAMGGKNTEAYKNVLSTMKKSIDLYEREKDKFTKYVKDTYGEDSEATKDILGAAEKTNEYSKKTYDYFVNNYEEWQEKKLKGLYANTVKNGLTDANDLKTLKECQYDKNKFLNRLKEVWKEHGYDDNAIRILTEIASEGVDKTLEKIKMK